MKRGVGPAYELVGSEDDSASPNYRRGRWSGVLWRNPVAVLFGGIFGILFLGIALKALIGLKSTSSTPICDHVSKSYGCRPEISHYWGQYSPYFSVPSEISPDTPPNCHVSFVQVLSRHGGRYPTSGKTKKYAATIHRIQNTVQNFSGPYAFLKDYKYELGADQLTIFGQQQMVNSGMTFYDRYSNIAKDHVLFVRASDQQRVVDSGRDFTQGFHTARLSDPSASPDDYPYNVLTISESKGRNNTLSNGLCRAFRKKPYSKIGRTAQKSWLEIFGKPIAARLNSDLPGAALSLSEMVYMMDLCPFNTIASETGLVSPFCALFTEEEWHQYDYFESLGKYYGYGNGNPMASTLGVGFTNELIARMTRKPVEDHTSVNHTLDDSGETFPLGNNSVLFADFSHDNDMSAIYSTLGFYNNTVPLSNTSMETTAETNGFSASWTVPFAARAYFEKLQCEIHEEEMVRILVNNRVLPLKTCGANELGLCSLGSFIESLSFARGGGRWNECFN